MKDTHDFTVEPERRVPVGKTADVLVAGGGPAGIAAAIAAAREGAKVVLVERYGYLGGMMTGAHVTWVLGVGDGLGPKARGVTLDIRERLQKLGAVKGPNERGDYAVDVEVFKWQAAEMLREAGAEVLLHTLVCDPVMKNKCVGGAFTESKSGRSAMLAKVTIDCSADADVAFRAGCECDNETHDVMLGVKVGGVDHEKVAAFRREDPERCRELSEEAAKLNGGVMLGKGRNIKDIDVTSAEALTRAEIDLRRGYFSALAFLRRHVPGWENARIEETLPQLGVRQSRRIHGEYTVTDDDLRASRHFEDGIARLGACLTGYALYDPKGLDYDIPFRCLVPIDVDGLLVAGRCVSCDYLACNSLRLIVPCLATGQAAGVAAALAVRGDVAPRDVPIADLRDSLARQDVYLGDVT